MSFGVGFIMGFMVCLLLVLAAVALVRVGGGQDW